MDRTVATSMPLPASGLQLRADTSHGPDLPRWGKCAQRSSAASSIEDADPGHPLRPAKPTVPDDEPSRHPSLLATRVADVSSAMDAFAYTGTAVGSIVGKGALAPVALSGVDDVLSIASTLMTSVRAARALVSTSEAEMSNPARWVASRIEGLDTQIQATESLIRKLQGEAELDQKADEELRARRAEATQVAQQAIAAAHRTRKQLTRRIRAEKTRPPCSEKAAWLSRRRMLQAARDEVLRVTREQARALREMHQTELQQAEVATQKRVAHHARQAFLQRRLETLQDLRDGYQDLAESMRREQHDERVRLGNTAVTYGGRTVGGAGGAFAVCSSLYGAEALTATVAPVAGAVSTGARAAEVALAAGDLHVARRRVQDARKLSQTDDEILLRLGANESQYWQGKKCELTREVALRSVSLGGSGAALAGACVLAAHPLTGLLLAVGGALTLGAVGAARVGRCMTRRCTDEEPDDARSERAFLPATNIEAAANDANVLQQLAEYANVPPPVLGDALQNGEGPNVLPHLLPSLRTPPNDE